MLCETSFRLENRKIPKIHGFQRATIFDFKIKILIFFTEYGRWSSLLVSPLSVFSRDLKDASEMLGCFSSGAKEFQNFGPEIAKLRGLIRTVRVQGTVKSP